ncbi:hypothetical protein DM02DRAFT_696576 [Periconia macrospinosa]|uniref:Uncharacterized protein n=1 Tax=Periconia macrospinosa TaxID=97972 RepID=A0A2V1EE02_9PLEO|nr:hypothetical protein DM02DRAFT_696576 [Periconia macrospinosa]
METYWKRLAPYLPSHQARDGPFTIHNKTSSSSPLLPQHTRSPVDLNDGKQPRSLHYYGSFHTSAQEGISHPKIRATTKTLTPGVSTAAPITTPRSPSTCGRIASVQTDTPYPLRHAADNRNERESASDRNNPLTLQMAIQTAPSWPQRDNRPIYHPPAQRATSPQIKFLHVFGDMSLPSPYMNIYRAKDALIRMLPRNLQQLRATDLESASLISDPNERVLGWLNSLVPYSEGIQAAPSIESFESSESDTIDSDSSEEEDAGSNRRLSRFGARDEDRNDWDRSLVVSLLWCLVVVLVGGGMLVIWLLQHQ